MLVSRDIDDDAGADARGRGVELCAARPIRSALHKAALVLRDLVPADADPQMPIADLFREHGGMHLSTGTNIPRGSGLGTSSILAGAVLAAL